MKLQEIISKITSGEFRPSDIQFTNSYLPLLLKRQIRNTVSTLSTYIDEETDMMKSDKLLAEMYTSLMLSLETTDIEIDGLLDENNEIDVEVAIASYDSLIQSGLYCEICKNIQNNDLDALIYIEIQQRIDNHNSVASVLNRAINLLISKIPNEDSIKELITQLPAQLASLGDLSVLTGGKKGKKKA